MCRKYKKRSKRTTYGGNVFRSEGEAKWAVFFDCLGIEYDYEPHYSEVETGCRTVNYMPDFFLPGLRKYIEIKPSKPYEMENIRAAGWSKHVGDIVILFNINPPTEKSENGWLFQFEEPGRTPILFESICWGECPKCGHIDLAEYGLITSCGCYTLEQLEQTLDDNEEEGLEMYPRFVRARRLLAAYQIAKSHEFGKGKSGRVAKLPVQYGLWG